MMKYTDYTVEDFLLDGYFVKWAKRPDKDSDFFWKSWIKNHPEKYNELMMAKELVLMMDFPENQIQLPSDKEIELVHKNILANQFSQGRRIIINPAKNHRHGLYRWLKVAAVLLLPFAGISLWLGTELENGHTVENVENQWIVKQNPQGQKSVFNLPDGTKVNLNAGSKLTYPCKFDGLVREVTVEGEAFFQVEKDPSKPFIVHTGEVQTEVLGTSFNVKAFLEEEQVEIALLSGKIKVYNKENISEEDCLVLQPEEMVKYAKKDKKMVKSNCDLMGIAQWRHGVLQFDEESLDKVFPTLERWYGVNFHHVGSQSFKGKFTGKFDNQSLKIVMDILSETSGFQYKIDGKKVLIKY